MRNFRARRVFAKAKRPASVQWCDGCYTTDGGIETRIIYEFKRPIGDFEAYQLLADKAGRDILQRIYQSYTQVARRYGLPIQLGTPPGGPAVDGTKDVGSVNAAAVELLRAVRQQVSDARIILAGVIGPASDGYATNEALSADAAFAYHRDQADVLAGLGVDLLYAPTLPAFSELSGVARAMAETGRPYALAPMLRPNGTMLDGTPLADAIARIDAEISPPPRHYMIGCLYPTHAQTALQALRAAQSALVKRVRGLKANASPLAPEDLDNLNHLAPTDVQIWARDELRCAGVQSRYAGWLLWDRRALYRGSGEGGGRSRRIGRLGTEKCYNFRLAMTFLGAAYCMSQGQSTLLLVVH
jgi:S-methylmethionine-dependent homocysteine/selenocysteine methylase